MWRTHLTLALRRLMRRPGRAALHVLGLGLGLAACFVVGLYALHELTYDRFHANAERIYRVQDEISIGDHVFKSNGVSNAALARMEEGVPGFEGYVQAAARPGIVRVPETGAVFEEEDVLIASESLFEVFSFPLVRGDVRTVLAAPDGAVVTERMAQKLFGDADPIGQTFTYERGGFGADSVQTTYRVTGIAEPPPGNSSIRFAIVLPQPPPDPDENPEVAGFNTPSYVLLRDASDTTAVLQAVAQPADGSDVEAADLHEGESLIAPFLGYHAAQEESTPLLYLFGTMALLVLVIAVINYTNLATAQAVERGREVGVRKTLGASRLSLRGQFVAESLLLALAAGTAAFVFALVARPVLSAFFDIEMAVTPLTHPWMLGAMAALVVLTGLVAGAYPAFVLARQKPVEALRGPRSGRERGTLRRALVVVQFALAVGMIAATGIVDRQLRYGQDTALSFDGDQIALLDLSAPALQHAGAALRDAMQNVPGVARAVRASAMPGGGFVQIMGKKNAGGVDEGETEGGAMTAVLTGEPGFSDLLKLTYLAGRPLRAGETDAVVLNERAARTYGLMTDDPQTAIGQKVDMGGVHEVVGVVSDFFVSSLKQPIQPVAVYAAPETDVIGAGYMNSLRTLAVELQARQTREALAGMEAAWKSVVPDYPFQYTFVSDAFAEKMRAEARVRAVFGAAALLAALLACLGLFGLAAFAAEQRRKEIGVRKALGASVQSLVALLSRDFALLVGLAFVVAAPTTYFLMQKWLERFTYRIDVGVGTLLAAGGVVLLLALITVSYHALRAATADPTHALRSE